MAGEGVLWERVFHSELSKEEESRGLLLTEKQPAVKAEKYSSIFA